MPNATITESIKFAGPDSDGNFKVLQTKNTTLVFPGEVYTMSAFKELVEKEKRRPSTYSREIHKLEVTAVEAKLDGGLSKFGMATGPTTFSEENGGKVLNDIHWG